MTSPNPFLARCKPTVPVKNQKKNVEDSTENDNEMILVMTNMSRDLLLQPLPQCVPSNVKMDMDKKEQQRKSCGLRFVMDQVPHDHKTLNLIRRNLTCWKCHKIPPYDSYMLCSNGHRICHDCTHFVPMCQFQSIGKTACKSSEFWSYFPLDRELMKLAGNLQVTKNKDFHCPFSKLAKKGKRKKRQKSSSQCNCDPMTKSEFVQHLIDVHGSQLISSSNHGDTIIIPFDNEQDTPKGLLLMPAILSFQDVHLILTFFIKDRMVYQWFYLLEELGAGKEAIKITSHFTSNEKCFWINAPQWTRVPEKFHKDLSKVIKKPSSSVYSIRKDELFSNYMQYTQKSSFFEFEVVVCMHQSFFP